MHAVGHVPGPRVRDPRLRARDAWVFVSAAMVAELLGGLDTEDAACIDLWLKDVAPSTLLRQWYGHRPERFEEFRRRYLVELADPLSEAAGAGRTCPDLDCRVSEVETPVAPPIVCRLMLCDTRGGGGATAVRSIDGLASRAGKPNSSPSPTSAHCVSQPIAASCRPPARQRAIVGRRQPVSISRVRRTLVSTVPRVDGRP